MGKPKVKAKGMNLKLSQAYIPWFDIKAHHTPEEYARFCEWMTGQTCSGDSVYRCDYERWLESGMPALQGSDWD